MKMEQETARKIVEYLDHGTATLDDATVARLGVARRQAVAAMPTAASVHGTELAHSGLGNFVSEHLHGRNAWMTLLAVLAIALMATALMRQNSVSQPVDANALLLASELPPEAYLDKGFDAWLENSSQH